MRLSVYIGATIAMLAGCAVTPQDAAMMSDSGLCERAHQVSMEVGTETDWGDKRKSAVALKAELDRRGIDCARYLPARTDVRVAVE